MLGVSGSRARPRVYAGKSITSVVQQLGKKALKLSAITKTETREIAGGFSCGERRPEAREIAHGSNVCRRVKRLHALIVSSKWNKNHGASRLLSHHHLRRPNGKMKLPKFLRIPKFHRRTRSKARSEISPIEGESEADLAVPRPTESTPDLRTGTSTFPTPSPLVPRDRKSDGV